MSQRERYAEPAAASWRQQIDDVLADVVPAGRVALANFPNHRNAGDVALWTAARQALERLDRRVAYRCAWNGFSGAALRRSVGDGPILLNGGGNLGDLYAGQQGLREEIMRTCGANPIVQLPQSIWFEQQSNLDRMRRLVGDHGRVTLLCRDERSRSFADAHFDADVRACPDLVLALDPVARPADSRVDILWLSRRDPEASIAPIEAADVEIADWLALEPGEDERAGAPMVPWIVTQRGLALFQRSRLAATWLWRPVAWGFDPIAAAWTQRARTMLSRGRVVVTDRLHAHVLALAMGIPTVVLDNSYGKVHAVVRQHTAWHPLAHVAADAGDALVLARRLVATSTAT